MKKHFISLLIVLIGQFKGLNHPLIEGRFSTIKNISLVKESKGHKRIFSTNLRRMVLFTRLIGFGGKKSRFRFSNLQFSKIVKLPVFDFSIINIEKFDFNSVHLLFFGCWE